MKHPHPGPLELRPDFREKRAEWEYVENDSWGRRAADLFGRLNTLTMPIDACIMGEKNAEYEFYLGFYFLYAIFWKKRGTDDLSKNILILTCVSGFLDKFQKDNVAILQKLGYTIYYASNMNVPHYLFDPEEFSRMGITPCHIPIERSPFMVRNNEKALRELVRLVMEKDISAIHCHAPVGGMLGRLTGRICNRRGHPVKVIYTAHGFHFYRGAPLVNNTVYREAERLLAHDTDVLITINREDFESSQRMHLKKGGKRYQIPGVGVDMAHFCPMEPAQRLAWRKKLGLEGKTFFVSVGELNENKNHIVVLKALKQMQDSGKDISNLVYGICGDGFFRERMEGWIQEMGLSGQVILFGYQKDVWPFVGCADAMIFPSRREGLGMAAVEALSMGIPVIAADNRGTREYMKHRENGYVCRWNDVAGFVSGMEYIMGLDSQSRSEMSLQCRQSVYGFRKQWAKQVMEGIYQDVL